MNLSNFQQDTIDAELRWMVEERNRIIKLNPGAPRFLFEHEVKLLFTFIENKNDLNLLLKTLWITGCRVSEALLLTPENFKFDVVKCYLALPTLKRKNETPRRHIQLTRYEKKNAYISSYVTEINSYIESNKISSKEVLFKYLRQNVNLFITNAQRKAKKNGCEFPFNISAHTFRHSCAMNMYLNGFDEKLIQSYLGHLRLEHIKVYAKFYSSLGRNLNCVPF